MFFLRYVICNIVLWFLVKELIFKFLLRRNFNIFMCLFLVVKCNVFYLCLFFNWISCLNFVIRSLMLLYWVYLYVICRYVFFDLVFCIIIWYKFGVLLINFSILKLDIDVKWYIFYLDKLVFLGLILLDLLIRRCL